ncbi:hypothetical protein GA0111570_103202 [Raineyella antarctica]|uniref:Uncharacterized protein n=1 Tax=Raineyella antarctica TaxID=1577474 RepID=A0A1G6GGD8_9ACTN|nr:hypothetical protein [Raineyella antarctica]SDB81057.1 hypothetical protein GA0111570_103202 [Raineyella antarctica]
MRSAALIAGLLMAVYLVLPQFWLPAPGRMAFGVAFLLAAVWFGVRTPGPSRSEQADPGSDTSSSGVLGAVQDRGLAHQ